MDIDFILKSYITSEAYKQ